LKESQVKSRSDEESISTIIDVRSEREKRIEREAFMEVSLGRDIDKFVNELIEIGKNTDFISFSSDAFDKHGYHIRTREIGKELHEIGGISLMQAVFYRVLNHIGPHTCRALEFAWSYIGDWLP
jgi:hypothetical protein